MGRINRNPHPVLKNKNSLYAAFKAKDARFDGRIFVGISSTGIYCRPVCRAKQPKIGNCTFFPTAAAAEQAGYRPCLLCRPEAAPGASKTDASTQLAYRAARLLEETCSHQQSLDELAGRLDCTSRHLRRVFVQEYHVTPVQYVQTCRLLLAKTLLMNTQLSVLDAAMTAGFGSLRRFNALFKTRYRLTPTALRKQSLKKDHRSAELTVTLGYRPPYRWEDILRFFAARAVPGIELVQQGRYLRTVHLNTPEGKTISGWICVGHQPAKHALSLTMSENLLPVLSQVLARVKHLFDLYGDPHAIHETFSAANARHPGFFKIGTRLPACFDSFEMAVRAILGQQISVKAANTLAARIVQAFGRPVHTGIEGLTHIFPTGDDFLALDGPLENHLGPLGVTAARAGTIRALAQALRDGKIRLDANAHPEKEIQNLLAVRGIGNWTAQYIAMRAMAWPDAFLEADAGVKKALGAYNAADIADMAESWRPWRSYATLGLWNTLINGDTP